MQESTMLVKQERRIQESMLLANCYRSCKTTMPLTR